jgi:hypothetical protein
MEGNNIYGYARNNPIRYNDPTGLLSEDQVEKLKNVAKWLLDNDPISA